MNIDINKRKVGLIMWHESGDEIHWFVITSELWHKVNEKIDSIPSNKWTNEIDWKMYKEVFDMFFVPDGKGDFDYSPEVLVNGFTQTWCLEDPDFLNKYEFLGLRTIPMY